jgi:hypothetical protein
MEIPAHILNGVFWIKTVYQRINLEKIAQEIVFMEERELIMVKFVAVFNGWLEHQLIKNII